MSFKSQVLRLDSSEAVMELDSSKLVWVVFHLHRAEIICITERELLAKEQANSHFNYALTRMTLADFASRVLHESKG